jgi:hypothetical protein
MRKADENSAGLLLCECRGISSFRSARSNGYVMRSRNRHRAITFIIMGCALLLVSFLYTRHRDTIRQYL